MSRRLIHYRNRVILNGTKVDVTATATNIISHHENGGKHSKPIKLAKAARLATNLARVRK